MPSVQTVDNVHALAVGLERRHRLRQRSFCQRSAARHGRWNAGARIEAVVLQKVSFRDVVVVVVGDYDGQFDEAQYRLHFLLRYQDVIFVRSWQKYTT